MSAAEETLPSQETEALGLHGRHLWLTRVWIGGLIAGAILPAFLAFNYIYRFGVNYPFWDEWALVDLLARFRTNNLHFTDLVAQHNEHRILFPRLVMLGLAELTNCNSIGEMYASWLLVVLTAALVLRQIAAGTSSLQFALLSFLPIPWLLFSLRQYENFLWGWQLQVFLCTCAVVGGAFALAKSLDDPRWMPAGIAAAFVATYSFGAGVCLWPAGLVALMVPADRRNRLKSAAVFGAAGVCTILTYLYAYQKPGHHPSLASAAEHPATAAWFALTVVGNGLSSADGSAAAIGALILLFGGALLVVGARSGIPPRSVVFGGTLVVFAWFSTLLVLVSRVGFGPSLAMASRYATISLVGFVGLYVLLLGVRTKSGWRTASYGCFGALFVLGLFASFDGCHEMGGALRKARLSSVEILRDFRARPDSDLLTLYADAQQVRRDSAFLEENRLGVFAKPRQ